MNLNRPQTVKTLFAQQHVAKILLPCNVRKTVFKAFQRGFEAHGFRILWQILIQFPRYLIVAILRWNLVHFCQKLFLILPLLRLLRVWIELKQFLLIITPLIHQSLIFCCFKIFISNYFWIKIFKKSKLILYIFFRTVFHGFHS